MPSQAFKKVNRQYALFIAEGRCPDVKIMQQGQMAAFVDDLTYKVYIRTKSQGTEKPRWKVWSGSYRNVMDAYQMAFSILSDHKARFVLK